jgi:hypothetical protein
MKKMILCASVYLMSALPLQTVTAVENVSVLSNDVNQHIAGVYQSIKFGNCGKLDYDVFEKAYKGYINLRNAGRLNTNKQILTICDLSKSSNTYRLWIIDLGSREVLVNDYVAHGQGSGEEFATAFSNRENSHQTSLGFYVTGETYIGEHGTSLRLHGMDKGFNDAAYDRAIVVHGAAYVSKSFVDGQQRLGRSWGCPAVSNKIAGKVISTIKDGTCLFVYAPQKKYLHTAYWLNKKIDRLPGDHTGFDMDFIAAAPKAKDTTVVFEPNSYQKEILNNYIPMSLPLF